MHVTRNIEERSRNYFRLGKAIRITFILWVCVCSLSYPACKRACAILILPSGASRILPHFSHINATIFGKKGIEHNFLRVFPETFLILRRVKGDIVIKVHKSSCKVPVLRVGFQWKLNFLDGFSKITYIIFHGNPSSGSQVVPCGRTDTWRS